MQVIITNLTSDPLPITELYTSVPANGTVTVLRSSAALSTMASLMQAITDNKAVATVTRTAEEEASGLDVPPSAIDAIDAAPVAATAPASLPIIIRKSFTAGAAGAADDVTIYAAGSLPYKMRILDVFAVLSAGGSGNKLLQVRSAAAGAGTLCAEIDSTNTGRLGQTATVTATQVLTPGTGVGLFIRRDQRDAAGEVVILARRES